MSLCRAALVVVFRADWRTSGAVKIRQTIYRFRYISEHLVVADLPDLVVGSTSTQGGPPDSYRDVMPLPGAGAGAGAESAL